MLHHEKDLLHVMLLKDNMLKNKIFLYKNNTDKYRKVFDTHKKRKIQIIN